MAAMGAGGTADWPAVVTRRARPDHSSRFGMMLMLPLASSTANLI
jgi:hypothetical protein